MAREAVKALKRERRELVRSLKTVDSVLAKLGATSKRRKAKRTAKAKTKKDRPERERAAAVNPKKKAKAKPKPERAPSAGSVDLEARRAAARAAKAAESAA